MIFKEPLVTIADEAKTEIIRLLIDEPKTYGLRLGIKGGGCSGLSYELKFTGRGFVFDNPMASNTCGCGESFSI